MIYSELLLKDKKKNQDYETYRQTKYFASLDGLRFLSIVAVIWQHTGSPYFSGITLLKHGYYGVHLFFAISGFLITTLLLREKSKYGDISLRQFYIRRTLRIFPLLYTVLGIYIILVLLMEQGTPEGKTFFHNLPYYLTYTSNWFVSLTDDRVIFYFVWSLATEEQFYLIWPTIEKYLKSKYTIILMILIVIFVEMLSQGFFTGVLPLNSFPRTIFLCIALPICFGVLLAHLLHHPKGYSLARKWLGFRWSSLAMFVFMVICLSISGMSPFFIYLSMALLVASCVIRENHLIYAFFKLWFIRQIGLVSYGMYLLHMLAYNVIKRIFNLFDFHNPILFFFITVIFVFAAAKVSYHYYEGYFLRWKERFSR